MCEDCDIAKIVAQLRSYGVFVQANADWNSESGASKILNKPLSMSPDGTAGGDLIGTYPNPIVDWSHGYGAYDARYTGGGGGTVSSVFGRVGAVSASTGDYSYNQISNTPTTVFESGITDVYTKTETDGKYVPLSGNVVIADNKTFSGNTGFGTSGTPGNTVEINSGVANASGLRFTSINSGSTPLGTTNIGLSIDANGDVGLYTVNAGSSPITSVFGRTGVVVAVSGDYNTLQVTENTNLYYTQARFNTAFAAKSTSDLAEGTNLYYTDVKADARITLQKGANSGLATLDVTGKVPLAQLPSGAQIYKGTWNASTNTPTLVDGTGTSGDTYRVTVAGTQNLGSGNITWTVGDDAIYNGTIWQRNPAATSVTSVNSQTGVVVLTTTNIAEGTNTYFSGKTTTNLPEGSQLYYTDARARAASSAGTGITYAAGVIALSNTGVTAATYTNATVAVNAQGRITSASNGTVASSVFGRTGAVVAQSGDYNTLQVTENTNQYFTIARARAAISVSGNLTYVGGVIGYVTPSIPAQFNPIAGTGITLSGTYPNITFSASVGSGTGDVSSNTAVSVTNEIALFTGTNGKLIKRAAITGMLKATTGVLATAVAGTDYLDATTTTSAIVEGSQLYFTNARARAAISVLGDLSYNATTGVISTPPKAFVAITGTAPNWNRTLGFNAEYTITANRTLTFTTGSDVSGDYGTLIITQSGAGGDLTVPTGDKLLDGIGTGVIISLTPKTANTIHILSYVKRGTVRYWTKGYYH